MEIALVVAMSSNRVIGRQGGLPWGKLADDMARFKELTMGYPVVMGRKTYESLPPRWRPLPGRKNIVVSRNPDLREEGATVVGSLSEAITTAGSERICVIGGGQIYAEALPLANTVYLTRVDAQLDGDTYFPELGDEWRLEESLPFEKNERNEYGGFFETYRR